MVDLFAQPLGNTARRPNDPLLPLLSQHRIKNWGNPVLELAIVIVGDDKIPDSVHSLRPQLRTIKIEITQVCMSKAFDKILLDPTRSSDDR